MNFQNSISNVCFGNLSFKLIFAIAIAIAIVIAIEINFCHSHYN